MKLAVRLTVFLLLLAIGVSGTSAANWYVRTDGNDLCNGQYDVSAAVAQGSGTWNCAFRSPNRPFRTPSAAGPVACGDTVYIRSGTYSYNDGLSVPAHTNNGLCANFVQHPTFFRIDAKACTSNTRITITGDPGLTNVASDPTFPDTLPTILDGNDQMTGFAVLKDSDYITFKYLNVKGITGTTALNTRQGFVACGTSDHINLLINSIRQGGSTTRTLTDGDQGFIRFGDSDPALTTGNAGGLIDSNYIQSYASRIISFWGSATNDGDGTDSDGLIIRNNVFERSGWGTGGADNRFDMDHRHLRNLTISGNYFHQTVPDSIPFGGTTVYAMYFAREMNTALGAGYWRLYNNVFDGLFGGIEAHGGAYGVWVQNADDSGSPCNDAGNLGYCNEELFAYNNTFYTNKDNPSNSFIAFRVHCNGCRFINNAFIGAGEASDDFIAYNTSGSGLDLVSEVTWSTIGYNFFKGVDEGMQDVDTEWLCGTDIADPNHACVNVGADTVLTAVSNDRVGSAGDCIFGMDGMPPRTFFTPAIPCLGTGDDNRCAVTYDVDGCDIGAFQRNSTANAPNSMGRFQIISQYVAPGTILAFLGLAYFIRRSSAS